MASCSTPLSIQRPLSSPCTARVITTIIIGAVLSGALSACIGIHIDLATNGTAVPGDTPPEPFLDEKNQNEVPQPPDTTTQCDLKSQVPNAQQLTGSWCWAASSQLVVEYLTKKPAPQCELVSQTFNLPDPALNCCQYLEGTATASQLEATCDQGGWPEWILKIKDISYTKMEASRGEQLGWAGLTKQICDNHPFIFVVEWSGGGRHSAVGGGYHTTAQFGNFVEIYDHSPSGFSAMPYQEFLGHRGSFTHEFDYVDIHVP